MHSNVFKHEMNFDTFKKYDADFISSLSFPTHAAFQFKFIP